MTPTPRSVDQPEHPGWPRSGILQEAWGRLGDHRQADDEPASLTRHALDLDRATVQVHTAFYNHQAKPRSRPVAYICPAMKRLESHS